MKDNQRCQNTAAKLAPHSWKVTYDQKQKLYRCSPHCVPFYFPPLKVFCPLSNNISGHLSFCLDNDMGGGRGGGILFIFINSSSFSVGAVTNQLLPL